MKHITTSLCLLVAAYSFSQEYEDTLTFKDGTSVPYYLEYANHVPPRYSVSISPLSLLFVSADGYSSLMGSAQAFVRLDDRMALDGRVSLPYGKNTDAIIAGGSEQKMAMELHGAFNYRFARNLKEKKRHVYLASRGAAPAGYDRTLYGVNFPAEMVTNYYVTGGLNFLRTSGHDYDLHYTDSTYGRYFIGNASSLSIVGGVTRDRYVYYAYGSSELNKRKYYYYRVRNYLLLTFSPMLNYSVYAKQIEEPYQTVAVSSGYTVPDQLRRLGWRFGSEVKMSGSHNGLFFGFECGRVHAVRDSQHFEDYYGSLYLMMKIGFEFGRKAPMSEIRSKK